MSTVINAVLDDNYDNSLKQSYLLLSNQLPSNQLTPKSIEPLLNKIKTYLSASKTRSNGLLLLNVYLNQLTNNEVLIENALFWSQVCLKVLQDPRNFSDRYLSCEILSKIFEAIPLLKSSTHLSRETSLSIVPQFIDIVVKGDFDTTAELIPQVIHCLNCCISSFSGSCGPKRHLIEKFIISCVKNISYLPNTECQAIKLLSISYSKLSTCGGSGPQGINHQNLWKEYLTKALITLKSLLDIYEITGKDMSRSDVYLPNDKNFEPLFQIDSDMNLMIKPISILHKIDFTCLVICALITDSFPSVIPMPIDTIFKLISEMVSINSSDIKNNQSIDMIALGFILPNIHQFAFNILEALVLSCKSALIIYSSFINKLIIQSLEWTRSSDQTNDKPFSSLRSRIYEFIEKWAISSGINCNFSKADIKCLLVDQLLNDIKPVEESLKLQNVSLSKKFSQSSKKRAKKNNVDNLDNLYNSFIPFDNNELTFKALRALKTIVYSFGPLVEDSIHRLLHKQIIDLLLQIYRTRFNPPKPYESEECRKELLGVLLSLLLNSNPHSNSSSPLEPIVVIFSEAQRLDESLSVKQFCIESNLIINCLIRSKTKIYKTNLSYVSDDSTQSLSLDLTNREKCVESEEPLENVETSDKRQESDVLDDCITIENDENDSNECIIIDENDENENNSETRVNDTRDEPSQGEINPNENSQNITNNNDSNDDQQKEMNKRSNEEELSSNKRLKESNDSEVEDILKDFDCS